MTVKENKVKEIMGNEVFCIFPDQTVFDASVLMATKGIGTLPVTKEDGTLVGILTDRDIVTRCNALGKDQRKTKIYECMSVNPVRAVPSTTLPDAIFLMSEYGIRRLPIVENDKLIGIISMSDIAKVSDKCPNEKHPHDSCILLEFARGLQKTSHLAHSCDSCAI